MWNERARKFTDSKRKESHKNCQNRVKELMKGNYGDVSKVFKNLEYLGNGVPGDEICLLTYEYVELKLLENKFSDDKYTALRIKKEKEIENMAEIKRSGKN